MRDIKDDRMKSGHWRGEEVKDKGLEKEEISEGNKGIRKFGM